MSLYTFAQQAARNSIELLAGSSSTYFGPNWSITTPALIHKGRILVDFEVPVTSSQWLVYLLVEDVPTPYRGDRVRDAAGDSWTLLEELPQSNRWISVWSVEKAL